MNEIEEAYAAALTSWQNGVGVHAWRFEAVTLRLAADLRYTPDFWVVLDDGTVCCDEVKGFWQPQARIKIKAAARLFPWFRFRGVESLARMSRKRREVVLANRSGRTVNGDWLYEEFQPWPKKKT
jgi:hypothetical protein